MDLNVRRKKILYDLLSGDYRPSLEQLADEYQISPRSVRYDLQVINQILQERELPQIVLLKDGMLAFSYQSCHERQVNRLIHELRSFDVRQLLPKRQRKNLILARLFLQKKYVTAQELAEIMDISRNTVIHDLEEVKAWLKQNRLSLRSLPQYGMRLQGTEMDIRRGYINLLREAVPSSDYIHLLRQETQEAPSVFPGLLYQELIGQDTADEIVLLCQEIQTELDVVFSDASYTDIVLSILYSLYRLPFGFHIDASDMDLQGICQSLPYKIICDRLIRRIKDDSEWSLLTKEDIAFIAQYVIGAEVLSGGFDPAAEKSIDRHMLLTNLITSIGLDLGKDFSADEILFHNLDVDVLPAMYRIQNDMSIQNPHLDKICRSYSEIYQAVKRHITPLEIHMGHKISEHELGFLAMHFIAACERGTHLAHYPRVIVMCGLGFGSVHLLVTRLKQLFHLQICAVTALRNLESCLAKTEADFIITTVPLEASPLPSVFVSPFLSEQDIRRIQMAIRALPAAAGEPDGRRGKGTDGPPGLLDVLTPATMDLHCQADNFCGAIRAAGELLLRDHVIEPPYIDSMVATVREVGPYIVFCPGVALPHSNEIQHVHRMGISMVRLAKPVVSGHPFNDPISLVFAFASPDNQGHLKAMMELGELVNGGMPDKLCRAKSEKEVLRIMKQTLS